LKKYKVYPYADHPFVERVFGTVGDVSFIWELNGWQMEFHQTNHCTPTLGPGMIGIEKVNPAQRG